MVSGRYFFPNAPLLCLKWMPASSVISVNWIGPERREALEAASTAGAEAAGVAGAGVDGVAVCVCVAGAGFGSLDVFGPQLSDRKVVTRSAQQPKQRRVIAAPASRTITAPPS